MDGFSTRPRATAPGGRRGLWLAVCLLLSVFLAAGCGQQGQEKKVKPIEVTVTEPITGEVRDYQDFTGRLMAIKSVDIRPRVTGYVKTVPFKEGQIVREGEVLFEIDSRSYDADLNLAKANLKLAQAEVGLMEKNATRAQRLIGRSSIAQEDYETTLATLEKDRATVESMEASRDRAKLYADWTTVRAPLSGRISRRLVDPGNLVTADTTILTTIVTENPLYAYFDVDERTFLDLVGAAATAPTDWLNALQFPVLMRLANEDDFKQAGKVDFIDNQVIATTGTIKMRGVFQNPKGHLKSGLFGRIRLPIGEAYKATLIPDEALQSDQGRKFVFLVKKGKNKQGEPVDVVEYRRVMPGLAIGGLRVIKPPRFGLAADALTALRTDAVPETILAKLQKLKEQDPVSEEDFVKGLARALSPVELEQFKSAILKRAALREGVLKGEQVIIVGQQRVRPGMEVALKTKAPPPAPENPFAKLLKNP